MFGDIALAVGSEFKKYLEVVLNTLQQASQAQVDKVGDFGNLYCKITASPSPDYEKSADLWSDIIASSFKDTSYT